MKRRILILALLALSGCANFEYDITRPAEFARHIGKNEERFTRDPVQYRLQTVDSRLVMLIDNPSDTPINLQGDRSTVVDQKDQSHPLRSIAIAPHSFAKLILPPPRPYVERTGPAVGVGFGIIGIARQRRLIDDPLYDEPQYFTVYDEDAFHWDWTGETDVRITLVYQQGQQTFDQEFVIARKKI